MRCWRFVQTKPPSWALCCSERSRPLSEGVQRQVPTLREYPTHAQQSLLSKSIKSMVVCVCHGGRLTWITVNLRDTHHPTPRIRNLKINSALADPTWASRGGGGGRYLSTTLSGRSRLEELSCNPQRRLIQERAVVEPTPAPPARARPQGSGHRTTLPPPFPHAPKSQASIG